MPRSSQVHRDRFLENLLQGLPNDNFIANQVLPVVPSMKESGEIAKMGDDHFKVDHSPRARGAAANRVDWSASSVPYKAEQHVFEHQVDDRDVDLYDDPFDAFRDATFTVRNRIDRVKEKAVAALVTTAANYGTNTDAAEQNWGGTGTPVTGVQTAKSAIISQTGETEDNLYGWCSYAVFALLRTNDEVKNNYLNTVPGAANAASLTRQQIALALGLRDLYVGYAVENTAPEGATPSIDYMWSATAFGVFSKVPVPGIMVPNFGYQVHTGGVETQVDRYREEQTISTIVRARLMLDEVVGDWRLGYLFQQVAGTA